MYTLYSVTCTYLQYTAILLIRRFPMFQTCNAALKRQNKIELRIFIVQKRDRPVNEQD